MLFLHHTFCFPPCWPLPQAASRCGGQGALAAPSDIPPSCQEERPLFPIQQKPQDGLPLARPRHTRVSEAQSWIDPIQTAGTETGKGVAERRPQSLSRRQRRPEAFKVLDVKRRPGRQKEGSGHCVGCCPKGTTRLATSGPA